jgi:uncharacterized protein YpuA (DUF1002 family)
MEKEKVNYITEEKKEEYKKVIEHLTIAHDKLSNCLEGKNRRGILTDISNTVSRIKNEYLNQDI